MSKNLFVLVKDSDYGTFHPKFTFNEDWIFEQEELYSNAELCHPDLGVDNDGFHYSILTVPDECTLESLGVEDCACTDEDLYKE